MISTEMTEQDELELELELEAERTTITATVEGGFTSITVASVREKLEQIARVINQVEAEAIAVRTLQALGAVSGEVVSWSDCLAVLFNSIDQDQIVATVRAFQLAYYHHLVATQPDSHHDWDDYLRKVAD